MYGEGHCMMEMMETVGMKRGVLETCMGGWLGVGEGEWQEGAGKGNPHVAWRFFPLRPQHHRSALPHHLHLNAHCYRAYNGV